MGNFRTFIRDFSYVMSANIISITVSALVTLFVPHFFGKEIYSYFQLENLYCGYIWLVSLGWHEGIYLKYGGEDKKDIDKAETTGQFRIMVMYLLLIGIILGVLFVSIVTDENKRTVMLLSLLSVIIEMITASVIYLLQATNNMLSYAKILIADRCCYFIFVVILIIFGINSFTILIGVDILSKILTLCIAIYQGKDFIFSKVIPGKKEMLYKAKELISMGININFAAYASRLISSIVQLTIEQRWGLIVFGKVTLTISISNMLTKFVNIISIVLFPVLRRTTEKHLPEVYIVMGGLVRTVLLGLFILYLPIKKILSSWLSGYEESLRYMAILLPISLFEIKTAMLINTYLKTLRQERTILLCNVITVGFSICVSIVNVLVFNSLDMAIFSIVILLAFRCILGEYLLSKVIGIKRTYAPDIVMTIIFIVSSWHMDGALGTLLYALSYVAYLVVFRKQVWEIKNYIINVIR